MKKPLYKPIRTLSNRLFDPFDPDTSALTFTDYVHGLAASSRYSGQTQEPLSTAFHCVWVSSAVANAGGTYADQYGALHHDATDAFLWDIPRPLKKHPKLSWLVARERLLQKRLEKWLLVPKYDKHLVAVWDKRACGSFGERFSFRNETFPTPPEARARFSELHEGLRRALGLDKAPSAMLF